MEKFAFIFKMTMLVQILEKSKFELLVDSVQYVFLLICFIIATLIMMAIPVYLCYSMIDSFIKTKDLNTKINRELCCKESSNIYLTSNCSQYVKSFGTFFRNFIALAVWNVFSLLYIIFAFDSFQNGLREYFYFPFAMLQSLSENEIVDSISEFHTNWFYMISIALITFIFYFLGGYFGRKLAKNIIKKRVVTHSFN